MAATVTIPYRPREVFHQFHARQERWACIVAHRRAGKTVASIRDIERGALTCERDQPRYAYIAPTYRQAKDIAWGYLKGGAAAVKGFSASINESELRVDYPNGGRVRLYGADNPDALRGIYLDGVVLDEYADIDPRLWPEVIRPALADREGWAAFIGTPRGPDAFYAIWQQAVRSDDWYALMLRASETGLIHEDELADARLGMSEAQYEREFECSFDAPGDDQFIPTSMVLAARERTGTGYGPMIFGVDPAWLGDDRSCIVARRGDTIERILTWRGIDTVALAGHVGVLANELAPSMIFVDAIGVGAGVYDTLKAGGYSVKSVPFSGSPRNAAAYSNKGAECWGDMRDWIRDTGALPPDEALAADLVARKYGYDNKGRIRLEGKADMRKRGLPSPDVADALALTFGAPVASEAAARIVRPVTHAGVNTFDAHRW